MSPDDSGKIWDAIDKLRGSQEDAHKTLQGISVILRERCQAREAAHKYALDVMREYQEKQFEKQDIRMSKIELDVSLLGLTKARLVGFGLGLAAMSSLLTGIVMKIIFGEAGC